MRLQLFNYGTFSFHFRFFLRFCMFVVFFLARSYHHLPVSPQNWSDIHGPLRIMYCVEKQMLIYIYIYETADKQIYILLVGSWIGEDEERRRKTEKKKKKVKVGVDQLVGRLVENGLNGRVRYSVTVRYPKKHRKEKKRNENENENTTERERD